MNFQVELHNFCNFTCGYCPNKDMERPRQFMTDEVWQAILNLFIVPYRHVNCHSPPTFIGHKDSEPLIDKRLPDRLRDLAAACPDMKIDIYSNGVLLPKWRDRGQDFMAFLGTLPNRVRYLMSYHPRNHDGSVNDYGATIDYLREVLRNPPPNVEFVTVSHRSRWTSEEDQDVWGRNWDGLPITVHRNANINPWTGRIADATCRIDGCPFADFGNWFFGVTGNVIACCFDLEEEIVLGNVLHNSPTEMFEKTAEFYAGQRRIQNIRLAGGRPDLQYDVCSDCFGYDRSDRIQLGLLT